MAGPMPARAPFLWELLTPSGLQNSPPEIRRNSELYFCFIMCQFYNACPVRLRIGSGTHREITLLQAPFCPDDGQPWGTQLRALHRPHPQRRRGQEQESFLGPPFRGKAEVQAWHFLGVVSVNESPVMSALSLSPYRP